MPSHQRRGRRGRRVKFANCVTPVGHGELGRKPALRARDASMEIAQSAFTTITQMRDCRIELLRVANNMGRLRLVAQAEGKKPPREAFYHYTDKEAVSRRMEVMKNYLHQMGKRFHECGIEKEVFQAVRTHWLKMLRDCEHKGKEYLLPYDFENVTSFHRVSGSAVVSEGAMHVRVRCALQDAECGKSFIVPVDVYEPWQCFKFSEATREEQKYFATVFSMLTLYGC